jgi:membrane-associated protease RseP (regulator of RpoE activity)
VLGSIIDYLLPFIVIVNIVVFIHSAGHFIGARILGIAVKKVSLGLGPGLFCFSRNNTTWKVCWIPIGGYVQANTDLDDIEGRWKQFGVSLSGSVAGIIFYIVVLTTILTTAGIPALRSGEMVLIPTTLTGAFFSLWGFIVDFLTGARNGGFDALLLYYPTAALRLILLAAVWSMKFSLFNLIPLPKLDGWQMLGLLLNAFVTSEKARKIRTFAAIFFVVLFVFFVSLNDIIQLGLVEF